MKQKQCMQVMRTANQTVYPQLQTAMHHPVVSHAALFIHFSNRISLLLPFIRLVALTRSPHVTINRQTKRRKTSTPQSSRLRTRRRRQRTPRDTPRQHAIRQVILRPESLDAALRAREDSAHLSEVTCRGVRTRAHIPEAAAELLAQREGLDRRCVGVRRERCIVLHLCAC
jgi:hypothetical protein